MGDDDDLKSGKFPRRKLIKIQASNIIIESHFLGKIKNLKSFIVPAQKKFEKKRNNKENFY